MAPFASANQEEDRYVGGSAWPDRAEALEGRFEHLLNQDLDDFEDQIQRLCKRARSRGSEQFKEKALLEDAAVVDANDGQANRLNGRLANGKVPGGSSHAPSLMRCAAWQRQDEQHHPLQHQNEGEGEGEGGLGGAGERSCGSNCLPPGLLAKTHPSPDDSFLNRCISDALEASPSSPSCPARTPRRGEIPRCVSVDDAVSWAGRLFSSMGGVFQEGLEVLLKSCSAEEFKEASRSREGAGGPDIDFQFAVMDGTYQAADSSWQQAETCSSTQPQTRPSTQATTATPAMTTHRTSAAAAARQEADVPAARAGAGAPTQSSEVAREEAMSCTSSCSVDSFYDGPIAEQPNNESTRRRRSYVIPVDEGLSQG